MLDLPIHLDGDGCWPDLVDEPVIETQKMEVAVLSQGMASGAPSVAVRVDLPDGRSVVAQTSLKLFLTAADAFKARYGDPR